jgi:hypothetical protein
MIPDSGSSRGRSRKIGVAFTDHARIVSHSEHDAGHKRGSRRMLDNDVELRKTTCDLTRDRWQLALPNSHTCSTAWRSLTANLSRRTLPERRARVVVFPSAEPDQTHLLFDSYWRLLLPLPARIAVAWPMNGEHQSPNSLRCGRATQRRCRPSLEAAARDIASERPRSPDPRREPSHPIGDREPGQSGHNGPERVLRNFRRCILGPSLRSRGPGRRQPFWQRWPPNLILLNVCRGEIVTPVAALPLALSDLVGAAPQLVQRLPARVSALRKIGPPLNTAALLALSRACGTSGRASVRMPGMGTFQRDADLTTSICLTSARLWFW